MIQDLKKINCSILWWSVTLIRADRFICLFLLFYFVTGLIAIDSTKSCVKVVVRGRGEGSEFLWARFPWKITPAPPQYCPLWGQSSSIQRSEAICSWPNVLRNHWRNRSNERPPIACFAAITGNSDRSSFIMRFNASMFSLSHFFPRPTSR